MGEASEEELIADPSQERAELPCNSAHSPTRRESSVPNSSSCAVTCTTDTLP